jgi:hypothetical protein
MKSVRKKMGEKEGGRLPELATHHETVVLLKNSGKTGVLWYAFAD